MAEQLNVVVSDYVKIYFIHVFVIAMKVLFCHPEGGNDRRILVFKALRPVVTLRVTIPTQFGHISMLTQQEHDNEVKK